MNSWPMYLVDLLTHLILIRLPDLILIHGELKPTSPTLLAVLSLTSSIISYSSVTYISMLIQHNSTDIAKINFTMTYLTGVA